MSIFSDLHRTQNQQSVRNTQVVGDLIDSKSIDYEQVLNNVKDILINWSSDIIKIKQQLESNNFFNKYNNDNTIKTFVSKLKGDLFDLNKWGTFDLNHVYDLFKEINDTYNCADNTPNTGETNTCFIISRELDDKRSVISLYNRRLKKYKRDFDDVWGKLLKVQSDNRDDRYVLFTTGTSFTSMSNSVTTLNNNYNNMKSSEGKLISVDSGNSLTGNIPLQDDLKDSKVNINYKL